MINEMPFMSTGPQVCTNTNVIVSPSKRGVCFADMMT